MCVWGIPTYCVQLQALQVFRAVSLDLQLDDIGVHQLALQSQREEEGTGMGTRSRSGRVLHLFVPPTVTQYDPFWGPDTFTNVQDTILPSEDTEKKFKLWSMSSFCHRT